MSEAQTPATEAPPACWIAERTVISTDNRVMILRAVIHGEVPEQFNWASGVYTLRATDASGKQGEFYVGTTNGIVFKTRFVLDDSSADRNNGVAER